jgi:hypothetical protein
VRRFLYTANIPTLPILVTLMKEAPSSSERRFLQEPHGVTSQKTAFFICVYPSICRLPVERRLSESSCVVSIRAVLLLFRIAHKNVAVMSLLLLPYVLLVCMSRVVVSVQTVTIITTTETDICVQMTHQCIVSPGFHMKQINKKSKSTVSP